MKCYIHPDQDAVGVCSKCGRGVCGLCQVTVKGRVYCKPDLKRILSRRREARQLSGGKRPRVVTASAILFVLYALGEIALAIFLMYVGAKPSSYETVLQYSPFASPVNLIDSSFSLGAFIAGVLLFCAAAPGILAGDRLWSRRKDGITAGVVQIVLGTVFAAVLDSFNRSAIASDILVGVIVLDVVLVLLLVTGRRSLYLPSPKPPQS